MFLVFIHGDVFNSSIFTLLVRQMRSLFLKSRLVSFVNRMQFALFDDNGMSFI